MNATITATRQLEFVPVDTSGVPNGTAVRFPEHWPSLTDTIDLSAATPDQAVEAWARHIGQDRPGVLVTVTPAPHYDRMTVTVEGRQFRAELVDIVAPGWETTVRQDDTPGQRRARIGELCSCGGQAVIVYETAEFGDIAYCGQPS